jgi:transposase-like protein
MKKKIENIDKVVSELPLACLDETAAVEFMEKQRGWDVNPACPRCGSTKVSKMKDKNGERNKRFLWRCHENGCKQQFTVRVGTVFEDSRVPLKIWCHAFWAACASKNGISALQIKRECNVTYKTALFIMHRIRYAMTEPNQQEKLQGTIEADETYVGGKPRFHGEGLRGRGTPKTPVLALVERNGDVRTRVVPSVTAKVLRTELQKEVKFASRIITDENPAYKNATKVFWGGHKTVCHSRREYVRGDIYTNTAESFFARLKRGLYGTFHSVSKKHLHRYINEFAFRWNTRQVTDGERITQAIKGAEGKRLMYREPIAKSA